LSSSTLLVVLAHPDDEVLCAGTLLAQRSSGSRVVVLWLTRGEMTQAFGDLPAEEVAKRRMDLGHAAGELLGVETRFLDFPDTGLEPTRELATSVAAVIAEVKPDGLLTWGESWSRAMRHPDHQATAKVARDAITLARVSKVVTPLEAHREFVPLFTLRDRFSSLPALGVDVTPYSETIFEVASHYYRSLGFGERSWVENRLLNAGKRNGVLHAEEVDAWETEPGLVSRLLPPCVPPTDLHPSRDFGLSRGAPDCS
jgi:N-acetylglucosamine malate deacetylase 1